MAGALREVLDALERAGVAGSIEDGQLVVDLADEVATDFRLTLG